MSLKEKKGTNSDDVLVEIQVEEQSGQNGNSDQLIRDAADPFSNLEMSLLATNSSASAPIPDPSTAKPPPMRQRNVAKSPYCKPKSRVVEPPYPSKPMPTETTTAQPAPAMASPSPRTTARPPTPKTSSPITPRTPLMASAGGDDGDDDNDDEVYKTESVKLDLVNKGSRKVNLVDAFEWIAFVSIMAVLIASLTIRKLRELDIWSLELWKWTVLVLVIFCGRLFTQWFINTLVFFIEKNFLLKKKVLYFLFGLKKSVRVVIWLALILLAWALLINRGVQRSEETSRVLNYITRGIVSTLVAAVLWMAKTLIIKLIASSFHVRTFFDRIQESIFHQYILKSLLGPPLLESIDGSNSTRLSGKLSFNKAQSGKEDKSAEVVDIDKLYRVKREKISGWTMGGLIRVIRNSELPTISEVLDDERDSGFKVITSEVEARDAANKIFRKVAKHGHRYIDEDDLLQFMPEEEVNNAIPLFEGAAESRRIKKSAFRNWVVNAYNERKCLALSLSDAKTAIEELNRLASGLILLVIVIVWLLLMEITTTRVLVFISSQILLLYFMFGNTAKTVFEALIFVFIMHPFDVGDRCVIDGVQMVVDEMNILTTIFLKPDNEKVYYPNAVLATKAIGNFNRSPEMGDSVEFAVDFSTSVETIAAMKDKIKVYLESKPQQWNPNHSVQVREIIDVNKMLMALYVTHTMNFQNSGERGTRRSDLVFELKRIFEELGIRYRLLPQEVQISYAGGAMPAP